MGSRDPFLAETEGRRDMVRMREKENKEKRICSQRQTPLSVLNETPTLTLLFANALILLCNLIVDPEFAFGHAAQVALHPNRARHVACQHLPCERRRGIRGRA